MNNQQNDIQQNNDEQQHINGEEYYLSIRDSLLEEELNTQNKNVIKYKNVDKDIEQAQNNTQINQEQQNVQIKLNIDKQKQIDGIMSIKKQADQFYLSKNYLQAVAYYNQALQYLHYEEKPDQKNIIVDRLLVVNIFNNISKCYQDLKNPNESLKYAQVVQHIDPNNLKALFREAKAHEMKGDFDNAKQCYERLLQGYQDMPQEKSNIQKCLQRIQKQQKLKDSQLKKKMTGYISDNKQPQTITINKNIPNHKPNIQINMPAQNKKIVIKKRQFINRSALVWGLAGSIIFSGLIPFLYRQNINMPDPLSRFSTFLGELAYENQFLSTFGFFGIFYLVKTLWNYFTTPKEDYTNIQDI